MKRNMGLMDRIIRFVIAVVIGILYYFKIIEGTIGSVLLVLAGIFLANALLGFCLTYTAFHYTTCADKKTEIKNA